MTQKLIMVKWLPASGKSTWAKEYVKSTEKSVRINNDDLRASFYWKAFNKSDEDMISNSRSDMICNYLDNWYTVIVDNTNLNPINQDILSAFAIDFWVKFEIKEFAVDLQTCIDRDKLRDDPVGENVIRDMARKWDYYPEPPREFEKVVQGFWEDCFIFDIDGTLAYMKDRSPYDYSKVNTDGCHKDIADMSNMLKSHGYSIIICSWRKADCREETIKWLDANHIPYDELFMRGSDDNRKDSIVKYELLTEEILPHYYVKWVFDDRKQVVDMWRQAWLRCYQVAPWDF